MKFEITGILENILSKSGLDIDEMLIKEVSDKFEPEDVFPDEEKLHRWAKERGYVKAYDHRNRDFSCDDCEGQSYKTHECFVDGKLSPGEKICEKFILGD